MLEKRIEVIAAVLEWLVDLDWRLGLNCNQDYLVSDREVSAPPGARSSFKTVALNL
jgi:hypothetical protein